MTKKQIPGVTEILTQRRGHKTERLYRCANGMALGATKGGPLTLGNAEAPWEIIVFNPDGWINGRPIGFLTEAEVESCAARLAAGFVAGRAA